MNLFPISISWLCHRGKFKLHQKLPFDLKGTKIASGWGSAPDPTGGAYSAPPDPLAVRGEGEGRGGQGREGQGEGRAGDGRGGQGRGFAILPLYLNFLATPLAVW